MSRTELPFDEIESLNKNLSRAVATWGAIERGWQAVIIGLFLTGAVLLGIQIPW